MKPGPKDSPPGMKLELVQSKRRGRRKRGKNKKIGMQIDLNIIDIDKQSNSKKIPVSKQSNSKKQMDLDKPSNSAKQINQQSGRKGKKDVNKQGIDKNLIDISEKQINQQSGGKKEIVVNKQGVNKKQMYIKEQINPQSKSEKQINQQSGGKKGKDVNKKDIDKNLIDISEQSMSEKQINQQSGGKEEIDVNKKDIDKNLIDISEQSMSEKQINPQGDGKKEIVVNKQGVNKKQMYIKEQINPQSKSEKQINQQSGGKKGKDVNKKYIDKNLIDISEQSISEKQINQQSGGKEEIDVNKNDIDKKLIDISEQSKSEKRMIKKKKSTGIQNNLNVIDVDKPSCSYKKIDDVNEHRNIKMLIDVDSESNSKKLMTNEDESSGIQNNLNVIDVNKPSCSYKKKDDVNEHRNIKMLIDVDSESNSKKLMTNEDKSSASSNNVSYPKAETRVEKTKVYLPLSQYLKLNLELYDLYHEFKPFLLTLEQLKMYKFPRESPDHPGRIIPDPNLVKGSTQRRCCRCAKSFTVLADGQYKADSSCRYHPRKQTPYHKDNPNSGSFPCCNGNYMSEGCATWQYHVSAESFLHDVDFVKASNKRHLNDVTASTVYAVDCEMLFTTAGMEVAKVGIVGVDGLTVYESFVLPQNPILDYNTLYSGVSEKDLKGVRTTLADVQAFLLKLLNKDSILVGHGLENDLKALRLIHEKVVDTSVAFPLPYSKIYKKSLKILAKEFLNKQIQQSVNGHDCIEDARTCMELMLLKISTELETRLPLAQDKNSNILPVMHLPTAPVQYFSYDSNYSYYSNSFGDNFSEFYMPNKYYQKSCMYWMEVPCIF